MPAPASARVSASENCSAGASSFCVMSCRPSEGVEEGESDGVEEGVMLAVRVALESIEMPGVAEERAVGERERFLAGRRAAAVAEAVARGRFAPTPSEVKCAWCSHARMCPVAFGGFPAVTRARAEGARVEAMGQ